MIDCAIPHSDTRNGLRQQAHICHAASPETGIARIGPRPLGQRVTTPGVAMTGASAARCTPWSATCGSPRNSSSKPGRLLRHDRSAGSGQLMVAVGTRISPRPPHRSRRALLTHRAPPSGQTSCDGRFNNARRPTRSHYSDRRGISAQCPNRGRLTAVPLG
jgi:hypothetical protein